jgi:hypothetical protein
MDFNSQDGAEAYREEYLRKFWEKKNSERAREQKRIDNMYRFFRVLAFPIALFAILLIIDKWLPPNTRVEHVESGGQRLFRMKHSSILESYIHTESFLLRVPHQAHLKYPYSDQWRPPLNIKLTRIFDVPIFADYTANDINYSFEIMDTIHTIALPLPWLLLISAGYICFAREYSKYSWSLVFLPTMLFAMTILVMQS